MGNAGCSDKPGGADITAAAFGDIYDMSDGAPPIQKGGGHNDIVSGDTWYSTWAGDGTAYLIHDDGLGFDNIGGLFARNRLCRLDGDPNLSTDGFRGVNLNPGLLGNTLPGHKAESEWRKGYSTSIYEQDGVLYEIRHNRTKGDNMSPFVESTIIKSTDGGRNWVNSLGEVNAPLPHKEDAMFPAPPWTRLTFIQFGRGGAAPRADNADKYAYLTTGQYLARVPRDKLPDLNKDDYEYYKGGGLDGMLDSSWSRLPSEGRPAVFHRLQDTGQEPDESHGVDNVVYNAALRRYVATRESWYFAPGEGAHTTGKGRFIIYTSRRPWGPWQEVLSYGVWARAGWNFLLCNKFTTPDGLKMWYVFCGEYKGDTWNYGFQYTPLHLSTGAVDRYEAESAALEGTSAESSYPSFSGSGYVGGFAKPGDRIRFSLNNVNGEGWHIVRVRYTSPLANVRTLSVYVNGRKARRLKLSLNNSDYRPNENWTDRSDIYYLKHGANVLELRQDEGDAAAGVLIDYIAVSRELTHGEGRNVAPESSATASSGEPALAVKGCADGVREWSAQGTAGEWIRLDWPSPRTVRKVVLYDKVSMADQVTSGTLSFSDGSSVAVGKLQNDGQAGTVVTFPPKTIRWMKFTVDSVRPGTQHAGLGEIQVYADLPSR
ncbi:MAG: CBM35 domain-containing protein [Phycisphaerae bacterium]